MSYAFRKMLFSAWYAASGRGRAFDHLKTLRRAHRLDDTELSRLGRERLMRLMRHASATVPYYRRMISERGLRFEQESIESDIRQMPTLTKDVLRDHYNGLCSEKSGPRTYKNTSGGSTGEPVTFLQDRAYQNWAYANKLLFATWVGWKPGRPLVKIWGAPADIFGDGHRLKTALRSFAVNERILNCYRIKDDTWAQHLRFLNSHKPALIETYADAIDDLTDYIAAHHSSVHSPLGIITSAGVLHDSVRSKVASTFGCPVLNRYGSREVGDIACSCCEGNGLHVSTLTHFVEILDDEGRPCEPGQEGNVVVTLLTNFSMPLIRYEIGDRAVWSSQPCPCGRTSPTLAKVVGRTSDFLIAADGARVNGTALTTLLYNVPGIRSYQFRQTGPCAVSLTIVLGAGQESPDLKPTRQKLATLLGEAMEVQVKIRNEIEPTATGKHRYIINELISTR